MRNFLHYYMSPGILKIISQKIMGYGPRFPDFGPFLFVCFNVFALKMYDQNTKLGGTGLDIKMQAQTLG